VLTRILKLICETVGLRKEDDNVVRIKGLRAASMNTRAFWDTAMIALMVEAVRTYETSVYFYGSTIPFFPEGYYLRLKCQ
jgi:hypothetical protein